MKPAPIKPAAELPLSAFQWSRYAMWPLSYWKQRGATSLLSLMKEAREPYYLDSDFHADTGTYMSCAAREEIIETIRAHVPPDQWGAWGESEEETQ